MMTPERLKLEILEIFRALRERGETELPCVAMAAAKLDQLLRPVCAQAAAARDLATAAENYVEAVNRWDASVDAERMPAPTVQEQSDAQEALTDALRTLGQRIYQVRKQKAPTSPDVLDMPAVLRRGRD